MKVKWKSWTINWAGTTGIFQTAEWQVHWTSYKSWLSAPYDLFERKHWSSRSTNIAKSAIQCCTAFVYTALLSAFILSMRGWNNSWRLQKIFCSLFTTLLCLNTARGQRIADAVNRFVIPFWNVFAAFQFKRPVRLLDISSINTGGRNKAFFCSEFVVIWERQAWNGSFLEFEL